MNKTDSEHSYLSAKQNYLADKTNESRILEEQSSSDESDEEGMQICDDMVKILKKKILGHPLPSKSLEPIHFIDLAIVNSWFQYKQDTISNKIPLKNQNKSLEI
ncbi:hypothetical protein TNCV_736331 [Trichonephila clavipes]|nr:hypothetical protein TNCV_736331 [Trichonephila clavipes]